MGGRKAFAGDSQANTNDSYESRARTNKLLVHAKLYLFVLSFHLSSLDKSVLVALCKICFGVTQLRSMLVSAQLPGSMNICK